MENKDLFIQIITKDDIDELSEHIDRLLNSTYKMERDIQEVALELPIKFEKTIENYFIDKKRNKYDPIEFSNGLKALLEDLEGLDVVLITVAFEPNYKLIQDISSWFYHNVERKVVLDFEVDKSLIAGINIRFNGKYMDYSYRNIILEKIGK